MSGYDYTISRLYSMFNYENDAKVIIEDHEHGLHLIAEVNQLHVTNIDHTWTQEMVRVASIPVLKMRLVSVASVIQNDEVTA